MDEQGTEEPRVIPTARQVATICRPIDPAVRAWHGLERLGARLDRLLGAHLREHGLTRAQLSFLLAIGASEGLSQRDLAAELGLTKANISQVLDRLEGAGLVTRVPSARAYALYLTDAGRETIATVMPGQAALIGAAFSPLAPGDLDRFEGMVGQLAVDEAEAAGEPGAAAEPDTAGQAVGAGQRD